MQREHRLRRRNDFRRVFRAGSSTANRQFVVYSLRRLDDGPVRIGVSVSRKVGKAVTRNRVKRLVKEVLRQKIESLPEGTDLVIIARAPAATMNYHQVKSSLRHVMSKGKLLKQNEEKKR
ncbi:ribonuclease P protein component [Planifilum fulgidum]|uniref:Ribonuclease P protein component n=1 Tax=Planifilum fulgidum TaxID=201973 RepID=A0A1I2LH66_9BACL|nr:ribonuclease P protein component [Planifilum fulgidum]MBO2496428.1 ribonuclease P protein component [Bacillota bacterium]MBO2531282.1 ribonuclease P protein component [Thermoactinomycetaceae bacterium]SFF77888.1 ribonuclease P protein component [Planifilum fulgidum]